MFITLLQTTEKFFLQQITEVIFFKYVQLSRTESKSKESLQINL